MKTMLRFAPFSIPAMLSFLAAVAPATLAQSTPQGGTPGSQGVMQNQPNRPAGGASGAVQPAETAPPGTAPFGTLPPDHQKYLEDVLRFWEQKAASITRYAASFTCWEFDPAKTTADFHFSYAVGTLRYMKPDKGLYKVESLSLYSNQRDDAGKPQYATYPNMHGEWWVCDGQNVSQFDRGQKIVTKFALPREMQGVGIVNSPLPFVFGMDARKTLDRFWIRPIADSSVPPHLILLEVFPKRPDDAMNYSKLHVFLDKNQGLPAALTIFAPNFTPEFPAREHFEFRDWKLNASVFDKIRENIFLDEFIPKPEKDWQVVERNFEPNEPQGQPNRQAREPSLPRVQPANAPGGQPRVAAPNQPKPSGVR
jgi:TIGR03009 family protein